MKGWDHKACRREGATLRMRVGESGLDTVKKEEGMNWGGVWSGPGYSNWILGCSARLGKEI